MACASWRRPWVVAHWSLHRWIEASKRYARFRPVQVVRRERAAAPQVVIEFTTVGARVGGLNIEAAAKLLALVR
jgi:hypothetical protein